jgi:hypothetical protein
MTSPILSRGRHGADLVGDQNYSGVATPSMKKFYGCQQALYSSACPSCGALTSRRSIETFS